MATFVHRLGLFVGALSLLSLGFVSTAAAQGNTNPDYTLTVGYGVSTQGGLISIPVTLDNSGNDIQGWSFGVCSDAAQIAIDSIGSGSTTETVKFGNPPDFEQINLEPGGWTMGVVICFTACAILPQGNGYELAVADYSPLASVGTTIEICPCSTLGSPAINTVMVVNGQSIPPVQNCGGVLVDDLEAFVRADTNADGFLDLSDGIWLLNYLFQGGPLIPCLAANDANGDGGVDTADAIYIVLFYFAGGSAPPAPFPTCGLMPNQSLLDCESFPLCP